jgi:O-methyltransferase involved in polyketide biosynthesis
MGAKSTTSRGVESNGNSPSGLHAARGQPVPDPVRQGTRQSPAAPILGDATADQIVRTTDHDYGHLSIETNLILSVALRARKLDQVASAFLARHPDAVGLDLGAGLDTRFERLAPPATVDWYDVDFPAVAAARQRLIPEHPNAHVIGADVRDPDWLDAVPTGRPSSWPTA